jgi:hypothetical protein
VLFSVNLDKVKELYDLYEGNAYNVWAVFLDADVILANPTRKIEDVINYANNYYNQLQSSRLSCQLIAQLSPTTINTGVLFFQISSTSLAILEDWIILTDQLLERNIEWQHEQGVLQQLYLYYLQNIVVLHLHQQQDQSGPGMTLDSSFGDRKRHQLLPYDCSESLQKKRDFYENKGRNGVTLTFPVIRAMCFKRSLFLLNAMPLLPVGTSSPFPISKVGEMAWNQTFAQLPSSLHATMSKVNPTGRISGMEICLLNGLSLEEQVNMHDWNGFEFSMPPNAEASDVKTASSLYSKIGYFYNSFVEDIALSGDGAAPSDAHGCSHMLPLFYHGKRPDVISSLFESYKPPLSPDIVTSTKSQTLEASGYCKAKLIAFLREGVNDFEWMSPDWRTREQLFFQKYDQPTGFV